MLSQVIKLLGQERAKGMARLRFQAGGRVLATLGRMLTVEAGLNKVGPGASKPHHLPWYHCMWHMCSRLHTLCRMPFLYTQIVGVTRLHWGVMCVCVMSMDLQTAVSPDVVGAPIRGLIARVIDKTQQLVVTLGLV